MLKIFKISIILILLINIFSSGVLSLRADALQGPTQSGATLDTIQKGLLPDESKQPADCQSTNCGGYTLNDMVSTVVKISNFILGLVGSLALLAFVAGGLMMMLSAGNAEWVTRGKQTLIGAVVGLAIVFTSYAIIQLVFTSLGVENTAKGQWSISNWFNK